MKYPLAARQSVKTVTVDLYDPYRDIIHAVFPNAQIIADPFHIVVQADQALQKVRIRIMNSFPKKSHGYNALKSLWKLLFKWHSKLDMKHYAPRRNFYHEQLTENDVVEKLLDFSVDLRKAYWYYQIVRQMIRNKKSKLLNQV